MDIDGRTRLCGVIGNPVEHSLSPALHNYVYRTLGLNYRYLPLLVEKENLEKALAGITALNLAGVNVTSPYKEAVLPYLHSVHPTAAAIGAVNTLCNRDGNLYGFNTDGDGLIWSLRELQRWAPVSGAAVILMGAGGAIRAAAYALGAAGVKEMVILNRTLDRAATVAENLKDFFPLLRLTVETLTPETLVQFAAKASLVINGLPEEPWEWRDNLKLPPNLLAYDLRYQPSSTGFMDWAGKNGATASNGLGMLVGQAALSFNLFTGLEPPFKFMLKTAEERGLTICW